MLTDFRNTFTIRRGSKTGHWRFHFTSNMSLHYRVNYSAGSGQRPHLVYFAPPCIHGKRVFVIAPLYPLQDFKALYKYCIIIIIILTKLRFTGF